MGCLKLSVYVLRSPKKPEPVKKAAASELIIRALRVTIKNEQCFIQFSVWLKNNGQKYAQTVNWYLAKNSAFFKKTLYRFLVK